MSNPETPTESSPPIPAHAVPDPANPGSMIVGSTIAPIKANLLRNIGPLMKSGEHDHSMSGKGHEAPQPAPSGKANASAGAVRLFLPRFVSQPRTKVFDVSLTVVDQMTYEEANNAARAIVQWPGDALDPANSQKLRTMAKVYIDPDAAPPQAKADALACANEIVFASHEMPITPSSCQALTLAYATISRENEYRTGNHS